jgi:hypothetical protein
VILYGGAAGGGKSDGAIVWAAQDYDKPGYRAVIFRRSYPELNRHIIPRTRTLFKDVGRYRETDHTWTFRTDGGGESTLELAFLESAGDVYNHQGVPNARFAFDESTRYLSENMMRSLLAWQRTEAEGVKCQMGLFTNPIGPGFAFHHHLFIKKPHKAFRVYGDATWYEDKKPLGKTTCFIPSHFYDNQINLARNPDYEANLDSLPEALRQALKIGSWEQNLGIALDFDPDIHTCDPVAIPAYAPRWMSIDWGKDDIACALWYAYYNGRVYIYRTFKRPGLRIVPYAWECMERSQSRDDEGLMKCEAIMFCVLSHECFADKGTEKTQADDFMKVFGKYDVPLVKSDKDAEGRTMLIREYFRTVQLSGVEMRKDLDYGYWVQRFQAQGDAAFKEYRECMNRVTDGPLPKCLIFRDDGSNGNMYLIDTLPHLVTDDEHGKNKTLAPKQDDHGWDSLGYGLRVAPVVASSDVNDVYLKLLAGRIPESTGDVARTMAQAQEIAAEFEEFKPVDWKRERS